jgi:hypothetical protein
VRTPLGQRPPSPFGFVAFAASLGVRLTAAQRVLALVAFDGWEPRDLGPHHAADRQLARALFGPVDVVPPLARSVVVAVCGARSGKSYLGALRLLHAALAADLSQLAPGEEASGLVVAPDLRLARQCLRFAVGAVRERMPGALASPASADMMVLQRPDGRRVRLECLPASRGGGAVRGRSLVGAVLDEACFFRDESGAFVVNDSEVFRAIAPRIMRGGQLAILSTPWARSGITWELFDENFGRPTTALCVHAPTLTMRAGEPSIEAIVERERRRDPMNASREYDAEFVDSSASLLSSEDVRGCIDKGVRERPARPDVVYGLALDVGLRNDSSAALAFHVEEMDRGPGFPTLRMLVLDALKILKPAPGRRVSLDDVEDAVAGLAVRYRIPRLCADLHYADSLKPRLAQRGVGFVEASMSPSEQETRGKTLAGLFSSRAVRLLDEPTLVGELVDLKVQRHAGGRVSIGAVGKKHDDCADACLLAADVMQGLPACGGDAGRVEFRPGSLSWSDAGLDASGGRWVRVLADGREEMAATPPWAELADLEYEELRAQGVFTPESIQYFTARDGGLNVPVSGDR